MAFGAEVLALHVHRLEAPVYFTSALTQALKAQLRRSAKAGRAYLRDFAAVAACESDAEGVLEFQEGNYRFTEIILHPRIVVKSQDDVAMARELIESAHKKCLVTNSITAQVKIFPDFRVALNAGS
jgi:hypothetical protein